MFLGYFFLGTKLNTRNDGTQWNVFQRHGISDFENQETIDKKGDKVVMEGKGRHDPCVVPRAVPIVEAMAALVLADFSLRNKNAKI